MSTINGNTPWVRGEKERFASLVCRAIGLTNKNVSKLVLRDLGDMRTLTHAFGRTEGALVTKLHEVMALAPENQGIIATSYLQLEKTNKYFTEWRHILRAAGVPVWSGEFTDKTVGAIVKKETLVPTVSTPKFKWEKDTATRAMLFAATIMKRTGVPADKFQFQKSDRDVMVKNFGCNGFDIDLLVSVVKLMAVGKYASTMQDYEVEIELFIEAAVELGLEANEDYDFIAPKIGLSEVIATYGGMEMGDYVSFTKAQLAELISQLQG